MFVSLSVVNTRHTSLYCTGDDPLLHIVMLTREVRLEHDRHGERHPTVHGGQQPVLPRGVHPAATQGREAHQTLNTVKERKNP